MQGKKISESSNLQQLIRKAENLMIEKGDYETAAEILNQVIKKDSKNFEAYYLLGEAWCKQNNFSLAVEQLRKAFSLSPEHPRILHLLGWATFLNGDPESGRKFMLLSTEKLPDIQTYCDLAVLENGQGNYGEAMEYALKAKEIEPESEMVQEVIEAINCFKTLREQITDKMN